MNPAPAPGDTVGRFTLLSALGDGGMGAVFEATRTDLPLRVALKVMHPTLRERTDAVQRFLREAEVLATMRHPHIVDVLDFGVDEAHGPWIAMRLLDGESLRARLRRARRQDPAAVTRWALPVLAALQHAHANGVVHRDLKPENLFLARTADGHEVPTVLDFGVARVDAGGALTADGALVGTPLFMAPEQLWGARFATPRSDQYALALILYEALSGEAPFTADSLVEVVHRVEEGGFATVRERAPDVPEALSDAVMRALSKEPDDRFERVADLARALLPFADATDQARWSPVFHGESPAAPAVATTGDPVTPAPEALTPRTTGVAPAPAPPAPAPPAPAPPAVIPARPRVGWLVAAVGVVLAAVLALRRPTGSAPSAPGAVTPGTTPAVVAPTPPPRGVVPRDVPAEVPAVAAPLPRPTPRRGSVSRARASHDAGAVLAVPVVAPAARGANGAPIRE
jgi:serine/threonine-protein kinase